MTEHTPTPWTVGGSAHDWHRIHRKVGEYCGPVVAKCYGTRGERNPDAEHIVRAVNSHQILIDALTEIADNYDLVPSDRKRARAALALAEGETP